MHGDKSVANIHTNIPYPRDAQGLDFTMDYTVPSTNVSVYTEVSTDSDLEFGDVTVGATVSF